MKVYGNSKCVGCHKPIVNRDMSKLLGYADSALEHAPDCAEFAAVPKPKIVIRDVKRLEP